MPSLDHIRALAAQHEDPPGKGDSISDLARYARLLADEVDALRVWTDLDPSDMCEDEYAAKAGRLGEAADAARRAREEAT